MRLTVRGFDVLTPAGCFVMAPWAGRTGWGAFEHGGVEHRLPADMPPHAIHGTVRGIAWTVEDAGPNAATLWAPLGPAWPWRGRCSLAVAVHDDHLAVATEVYADAGSEPFPAALGWHPWFVKPGSVALAADELLERGDDHLPTGRRIPAPAPGERPLDDCFGGVRWPVVLTWEGGRSLAVEADGCEYAVVFDQRADATCVEPQTAPPDALRAGTASIVEPGHPLRAVLRLRWRW